MTSFTLSGSFRGRSVDLTWTDGELSGDPEMVKLVQALATSAEGSPAGQPGGPCTIHDHLSNPYTSRSFMQMVFSSRPTLSAGALPPQPDLPEGAVQ